MIELWLALALIFGSGGVAYRQDDLLIVAGFCLVAAFATTVLRDFVRNHRFLHGPRR